MPPELAKRILDDTYSEQKEAYKATLKAVADAKKLRPAFYEKKPRVERDADIINMLSKPRMEEIAAALLRGWLMKSQSQLLIDFLDALGLKHDKGIVEDFPPALEDAKLKSAVEAILAKHPREIVVVYLHAFGNMNEAGWENLNALLEKDERLQFA